MQYLKDLGVAALWLSPIFKSPNKDMGYDISDYKDIHPNYGNLTDFEEMVDKAHELGLKVILDFVPNHSSDEHRWFQEALKGPDNPYHNYYVWHEGKVVDGERVPPTNWGSVFEDMKESSAWKWVPSLNKYYYRTFHEGQPDLNYTNPAVVTEMKNVFRFWARKGVDGFRIDAIPYLFEDRLMRDNSPGGNERTENLPETYDMVRQWRQVFDEEGARLGKDLVMMLEAYATVEQTMKYYGTKDFPAGHFPFNFQFISNIWKESTAAKYVEEIDKWVDNKPAFGWSNWVFGNHDNHRVASRLAAENVDGLNMLLLLLPGTAVTYYGEELGMLDNTELKLKDCRDPQACPPGANETYYQEHSRDFERTPMQWDATKHAGFTTGDPWLPVPENSFKDRNVKVEEEDESSHLNIYKKLARLRNEDVVKSGTLKKKAEGNVVSFLRQTDTYSLLVLINLGASETTFDVITHYGYIGKLQELVSSNFDDKTLDLKGVNLKGNSAVVLGGPRYQWWQTGIVYQIYPRSFKDSDNDGQGDIKGITDKLEYLKELGVKTVWLSPIFKSPDYDMGYDISDFTDIHEDFGTLADFRAMVTKAHALGMKVVLDFVPNHSSSEHEWFQKALKKDSKYFNYYVWKDGKGVNKLDPPNNWRSVFDGSKDGTAWTYIKDIGQFYLHQFHTHQPDLNFKNPEVVQEIKDVLKFWIDEGVDGFRVDAITHLFEDELWRDNPENTNQYLANQPQTYEMVQQWRELLDEEGKSKDKELVLMLEASAGGEALQKYFGTAERPGGHFPFNFNFIHQLIDKFSEPEKEVSAKAVDDAIKNWRNLVPDHGWSNWVLGNHDQHRVASRVGSELIDAMNMLVTLLPGTAITYNGEEIGMLDNRELTLDDCRDDMACNPDEDWPEEEREKYFQEKSRDFQRTPFQWDDKKKNAEFCGEECDPWLPVPKNMHDISVKTEESARKSHLFIYKRLAKLRNEPAIQNGNFDTVILNDNVLCMSRKNDSYAYLVLINFDKTEQIVNVAEHHEDVGAVKETVSSGFASTDIDLSAVRLAGKAALVVEGTRRKQSTEPEDLKWWQKGIIYQIYPRSFQDSDGDGIGDLPGITSRLQYIRDLGVTAIWLSPIFSSPDADMGYDISDFKNINDIFGTLGDFDEMLQEAHRLGLKVMLDFVPNHSSDEHEWFQDAVKNGIDSPYYDYYVWREGKNGGANPPNNWEGAFTTKVEGSAWSKYKNPETGEDTELYYLHQFHKKQPDLNYRNPALVQEMKDVLSFWVRRGVDGFRVDAINHLAEDPEFRDNTPGLDRDMQVNQDLTYEIVKQWRDLLDKEGARLQKDLTLMLEVYADVEPLMKYFGTELRPAGDFPFNFYLISQLKGDALTSDNLQSVLNMWLLNKPEFGWNNWVVGNHDQHRVGSRLGSDLIDAYNMLVTLLPGTAITYNGEEIGMLNNNDLTVKDCQDPQACPDGDDTTEQYYASNTRDYQRTPIQWDNTENAGFTTGTPWLPVNKNYATLNVQAQEGEQGSHLHVYKKLAALRNELAVQRGDFHMQTIGSNVFSFSRRNVSHAYVVLINFDTRSATIELNKVPAYEDLPKMLKYTSSSNFEIPDEAEVSRESFVLPARASVVLTSEPVADAEDFSDGDFSEGEVTTQGATTASLSFLLLAAASLSWFLRA